MKFQLGTALAAFALVATTSASQAYITCNHEGDCWHTERHVAVPGVTFSYHPDDWYFHRHWDSEREHHWREAHEGRGYWRNGVWVTF